MQELKVESRWQLAKETAQRCVSYRHFRLLPSFPRGKKTALLSSYAAQPASEPAARSVATFSPVQPAISRAPSPLCPSTVVILLACSAPLSLPPSTAIHVYVVLSPSPSRDGMGMGEGEGTCSPPLPGGRRERERERAKRSIGQHIISAARLLSRFWGRSPSAN